VKAFRDWPLVRVLLLGGVWTSLNLAFIVYRVVKFFRSPAVQQAGIGAVAGDLRVLLLLLFVPPLALVIIWYALRR